MMLKTALTQFTSLHPQLRTTSQPGVSTVNALITDLAGIMGTIIPGTTDTDPTRTQTKDSAESSINQVDTLGRTVGGTLDAPLPSAVNTPALSAPFTPQADTTAALPRALLNSPQEQNVSPMCITVIPHTPYADQRVLELPLPPRIPTPPVMQSPLSTPTHYTGPNTRINSNVPRRPSVPLPVQLASPVTFPPQSPAANNTLNLDDHGQPLRYASTKAGPNALRWEQAESEELDRLLATATIRPIFLNEQPIERRKDTTYYNPQTKEKETAAGERTYRIRGTIGGDRIHYPGPTTARTAAMPLVKILLQSLISDES